MQHRSLNPERERTIYKQVDVVAAASAVWAAWTTADGVKSFFAPGCNIELKVHGAYEILFDTDAEPGTRGSEGCMILAIQPQKMLAFTWSAPPHLPEARAQRTVVIIRLQPVSESTTRVTLDRVGWGEGGQWDQAYEYFDKAWEIVLYRLKERFDQGPVDWSNPPRPH